MMTSLGSESQLDIKQVCVFVLKHAWSYNIRHGAQIILYICKFLMVKLCFFLLLLKD